MRFVAPVGIVASVGDEGLLFSPAWPRSSSRNDAELVVAVEGVPGEEAEALPIPGAARVLAESIAGWWGAHHWSYPDRTIAVRVDSGSFEVGGWPISHLAAVLEEQCDELGASSWSWGPSPGSRRLIWSAGSVEIVLVVGQAVRVTYPTLVTDSGYTRVSRGRDEVVLAIDDRGNDKYLLVWLGYPSDVGWTVDERLACPIPVGLLPRCLHIPRSRRRA